MEIFDTNGDLKVAHSTVVIKLKHFLLSILLLDAPKIVQTAFAAEFDFIFNFNSHLLAHKTNFNFKSHKKIQISSRTQIEFNS